MPDESPSPRRVQRVRHELKRREVEVAHVQELGPHFRRIVFSGDSLSDFVSASFDDHVKVFFDGAMGAEPARRDYTPRAFDNAARTLSIEFALHGSGPAADWAAQAIPGQRLSIGGPKGSLIIPADYDWHLLTGDLTALPAIARRLEELPPHARALAILHVPDEADRREFDTAANLVVNWVADDAEWLAAIQALALPDGEGFAWCAGEAGVMAAVRRILVDEKSHPREAIRAAAYWKRGAHGHHENLDG